MSDVFDRPTVWADWCQGRGERSDTKTESLADLRARVLRIDASLASARELDDLLRAAHERVPLGGDRDDYEHAAHYVVESVRARLAQQLELQRRRAQHQTPRAVHTRPALEQRMGSEPAEAEADEWRMRID